MRPFSMRSRARFAVCQLLLLASAAAAQDYRKYYYEDIFQPFFVQERSSGEYRSTRSRATPSRFPAVKKPGTFRVFVVGGSIAQGHSALKPALSRALPDARVDFLNCGMGGYDSYREAIVLEEVLQYSPDLIVLMTGHNEQVGSPPIPLWLLHAQDGLSRIDAYRALAGSFAPRGDPEQGRAHADVFRRNLSQMVEHAGKAGVPIVLVGPPLNYSDAPNPVSQSSAFFAAWTRYVRGDAQGARAGFEAARREAEGAQSPGLASLALFYRGRSEERLGQPEQARASYEAALAAEPPFSGRCGPVCRGTIADVARRDGAIFADVDAAFRAAAGPRLPGADMFADAVHWHDRWDPLVALTIVRALRESRAFKSLVWNDEAITKLEENQKKTGARPRQDEEAVVLVQETLSELRPQDDRAPRAAAFLTGAWRLKPGWFDDLPKLLRRCAARGSRRSRAWTSGLDRPLWLLRWNAAALWLEQGRYDRAAEELALAAQAASSPWLRRDLELARSLASRPQRAPRPR